MCLFPTDFPFPFPEEYGCSASELLSTSIGPGEQNRGLLLLERLLLGLLDRDRPSRSREPGFRPEEQSILWSEGLSLGGLTCLPFRTVDCSVLDTDTGRWARSPRVYRLNISLVARKGLGTFVPCLSRWCLSSECISLYDWSHFFSGQTNGNSPTLWSKPRWNLRVSMDVKPLLRGQRSQIPEGFTGLTCTCDCCLATASRLALSFLAIISGSCFVSGGLLSYVQSPA